MHPGTMAMHPVRLFQLLYCAWLALALLINAKSHINFYTWFKHSNITLARKRGLGAHPTKIYGLFTPPNLTTNQLKLTAIAFISCLIASCSQLAPRPFLFAAYLLSLLYFPQLFAEATTSGHGTILVPSVLLLLSCSPNLDQQIQSESLWPLILIRIYLASGYFSSGMAKLLSGVRFNRFWGRGSTLQHYFFDGMWSRPSQSEFTLFMQRELMKRPRLLSLMATGALFFETGFVAAPFSAPIGLLLGISGFLFHGSIAWLQGLDFVSFWTPALFAYVVPAGELGTWRVLALGAQSEAWFFVPAAVYTLLQVLTAVTLYDLWLDDILPFSCCPMFMPPRNPFDRLPKWYTMTTAPLNGSTRLSGAMEPLYWSPASSAFHLSLEDFSKLPQRVVFFGSTTGMPPEALKFVHSKALDKPFLMYTNFEISVELKTLLHRVIDMLNSGTEADAWDQDRITALLDLQAETLRAFNACAKDALGTLDNCLGKGLRKVE